MLGNRADAQDLLQECWLRGQQEISAFRGNASALKAWWFGIASHLALDYLRLRKCWRVEAQLIAEQESDSQPDEVEKLAAMMSEPDFRYEVKEHIAFCFTCIGRTLDPTEEAALLLREVFEFSNADAARLLDLSEPAFRHKLSSARQQMITSFDGLCQLINKTGRCYQCVTLREFAPEPFRGELITRIEPAGSPQRALLRHCLMEGLRLQERRTLRAEIRRNCTLPSFSRSGCERNPGTVNERATKGRMGGSPYGQGLRREAVIQVPD